ncbi:MULTISPECIES: RES family NAD+ phosphorylase [Streptomyces]|uniref:RES family NAD+ phosphorylase n=1 Tax=Streptomyces edwardsiae TaxID=3075527 RepID=A0ABU2PM39_9ACTN|nr:RES family NAD+ phosphorylase [Streptomyces sp. DSM 41636]MDT0393227.1 RES family NAD+ phosphorylase [Streptomyces sp. DSM 41636]
MPKYPPPDELPGEPARAVLPAGTPLYRVHTTHRDPVAYNSRPSHAFYFGGRFDGTPYDRYGYLYAGFSPGAAVCEVLLRSLAFPGDGGPRLLPRTAFERRSLSFLRLAEDTEVVSLMSASDLAALAQDPWLVHAEGADYPQTRDWGHWIRTHTKSWAQGFVWPSKRDPADRVAVLFDDRGRAPALEPAGAPPVDFGTEEGERWLNGVLTPYLARTAPHMPGREF